MTYSHDEILDNIRPYIVVDPDTGCWGYTGTTSRTKPGNTVTEADGAVRRRTKFLGTTSSGGHAKFAFPNQHGYGRPRPYTVDGEMMTLGEALYLLILKPNLYRPGRFERSQAKAHRKQLGKSGSKLNSYVLNEDGSRALCGTFEGIKVASCKKTRYGGLPKEGGFLCCNPHHARVSGKQPDRFPIIPVVMAPDVETAEELCNYMHDWMDRHERATLEEFETLCNQPDRPYDDARGLLRYWDAPPRWRGLLNLAKPQGERP